VGVRLLRPWPHEPLFVGDDTGAALVEEPRAAMSLPIEPERDCEMEEDDKACVVGSRPDEAADAAGAADDAADGCVGTAAEEAAPAPAPSMGLYHRWFGLGSKRTGVVTTGRLLSVNRMKPCCCCCCCCSTGVVGFCSWLKALIARKPASRIFCRLADRVGTGKGPIDTDVIVGTPLLAGVGERYGKLF